MIRFRSTSFSRLAYAFAAAAAIRRERHSVAEHAAGGGPAREPGREASAARLAAAITAKLISRFMRSNPT